MKSWDDLEWWSSTDAKSVEAKLKGHIRPERELIYASMDECPLDKVKVVLCGQDPYPGTYYSRIDGKEYPYAMGLSFSIPSDSQLTHTLQNFFGEYVTDLHYPNSHCGNLTSWCKEGVLLWNVYLSCQSGQTLSHRWPEWESLTREVFEIVSKQGAVFILLGAVPRQFSKYISTEDSFIIEAPHPMADVYNRNPPTGHKRKRKYKGAGTFRGSRIFTRTNDYLCSMGMSKIDWRLP